MRTKFLPAILLLAVSCSKSTDETNPAPSTKAVEPASTAPSAPPSVTPPAESPGGDGTEMALEEAAKRNNPAPEELPPIVDMLELQAAIGAEYQKRTYLLADGAALDCDQLATDLRALHKAELSSQQRIAAYASTHADELEAITATLETDYARHTENAAPVIERCKDNKAFASAMSVPSWRAN